MFASPKVIALLAFVAGNVLVGVNAESHKISFNNKCGKGTPMLKQYGKTLSTGQPYTANGPFPAAIAYLQTGGCGDNGEKCTVVETTLKNPTSPGAGSSTDVTLIPPLGYSVPASFQYQNGCDGVGTGCNSASCPMAFRQPTDYQAQRQCEANNVNLVITFC